MAKTSAPAQPYRVLARKYRPTDFTGLIGQEALVRTLSNAFATGRIAHAFMLTGVRGVGKTTTARIIARALNCIGPDGKRKEPTIHPCGACEPCVSISESRNVDVQEMDAASRTGIDDIREIIEGVRYAPVAARYKVYIIDEVHMLSKQAFNGLLKTLEEPPPHVKFVFATTEIRKVPVTVLSRCQRFDLRRVDAALLVKHLEGIAEKEKIETEPAALALIARAAEGSVRDSLSLFDQAIAHAAGPVRAEDVRQMLGLADRVRVVDLFESLMKGDVAAALTELRAQYDIGADPGVILSDLAEFTHFVTRVKVVPSVADDVSLSEAERKRGREFATQLSMRVLSRTWQMLLKGVGEVQSSGRPVAAAEMVLVRIAYAADLPTLDEVIRSLSENGGGATARASSNGGGATVSASSSAQSFAPRYEAPRGPARSSAATSPRPAEDPVARLDAPETAVPTMEIGTFEEIIALVQDKRDITMKMALERDVRLVRCEDGQLEIDVLPSAPKTLVHDLQRKLIAWTGKRWIVVVSKEQGAPTLRAQMETRQAELEQDVQSDPLVQAVLNRFPGAKVVGVTQVAPEAGVPDAAPDESEED
jgi:DNA polymerase-3 subunit gamma/tau